MPQLVVALNWIEEERADLWSDLTHAYNRAIFSPLPHDKQHWSMEMLDIADRIEQAGAILGAPTPWTSLGWQAFPFYQQIEGLPLPDEAWEWIEQDRHQIFRGEYGQERKAWVLQYR